MDRSRAIQISYFLLRVVSGFLLFQSGAMKWFGLFGGMPKGSPPFELASQMGVGAVIEVIGGLCILLGLFTRPAAFLCSGMMAVAYWQFHAPNGTWPAQNFGMPAVLLCFIFLYIAAEGGGPWSLDAQIFGKSQVSRKA